MSNVDSKTSITMEDGRVVAFTEKARAIKQTNITTDDEGNQAATVEFFFRNGKVLTIDVSRVDIIKLACHGIESKVGDEYAGVADIDDCYQAASELVERLYAKQWNAARASAGQASGGSILHKALMEAYGKDAATISAFLSNKTQAEKLAFRKSERVAPIIARLEAAKASKKPALEVGTMLEALDSM